MQWPQSSNKSQTQGGATDTRPLFGGDEEVENAAEDAIGAEGRQQRRLCVGRHVGPRGARGVEGLRG